MFSYCLLALSTQEGGNKGSNQGNMMFGTFFEGKQHFNQLWLLLDLRAELDLMLTNNFQQKFRQGLLQLFLFPCIISTLLEIDQKMWSKRSKLEHAILSNEVFKLSLKRSHTLLWESQVLLPSKFHILAHNCV